MTPDERTTSDDQSTLYAAMGQESFSRIAQKRENEKKK